MALANVTTTFNLSDYIGVDYTPRRTKVYLTTNAENNLIADESTGEVRLGGGTVAVAADGAVTATHWAPGADGNPISWQTTFHIDHEDHATRTRRTVSIGPFTITTSGLLTALIDEQAVPAEYLTTVTTMLDGKVAEAAAQKDLAVVARVGAEAARDGAVAIAGPVDGTVEGLVRNTGDIGPLTIAALDERSTVDRARANHTGTQPASTVSDFSAAADARVTAATGTTDGKIPLLSTGGVLPIARIATGTPDGTKFVRDDGTLAAAVGVTVETLPVTWTITAGTLTWTTKAVMTTARSQLTSGVVDGKIYAIGGSAASYSAANEMYDPVANTWTTKAAMTTARSQLTSGVVGGKIYAIGGYTGSDSAVNEMYDPVANTWASKAAMTTARRYLTSGVVDGKIYAIGGYAASYSAANEMYDPVANTWTTKAAMTTARSQLTSGVVGGKIYAIGGSAASYSAANEMYDPVANTWTTKAAMTTARYGLTAEVVGGKIYAIGGYTGSDSAVNEMYDPVANTWASKAAVTTARRYLTSGVVDGKIYAIGGDTGANSAVNEMYDVQSAPVLDPVITPAAPAHLGSLTSGLGLRNNVTSHAGSTVAANTGQAVYPTGPTVDDKTATTITITRVGG